MANSLENRLIDFKNDLNQFINEYDDNEYEKRKLFTEESDDKKFKVRESILLTPSVILNMLTMRERVKKINYTDKQNKQLGELREKYNKMRKSRKLKIPIIDQNWEKHDQWTKKEHIKLADEVANELAKIIDEILKNI